MFWKRATFSPPLGKRELEAKYNKMDPVKRGWGNMECCITAKLAKPWRDLKELYLLELFPNQ